MGRQIKNSNRRQRCAALALLLCFGCVALAVQAQQEPAEVAKRIEQMRDQAAVEYSVVESQGTPDQSAEGVSAQIQGEAEKPLPRNETLPLGAGEGDLFGGDAEQSATGSLNDGWLMSTLAALGVVLAIVFGLRYILKRGGVVSTVAPQGSVVEVLSRTTVAPRSHVVLMRVGTRILVVSDSTAGMRTLASVDDAAEVAELLGAIDSAKSTSMSQSFGSVMKKLSSQWSVDEEVHEGIQATAAADAPIRPEESAGALSRVRGKLAALSDAGGQA